MKSDKSDFTQGSILKKLSLFMLPVLGRSFCRRPMARSTC